MLKYLRTANRRFIRFYSWIAIILTFGLMSFSAKSETMETVSHELAKSNRYKALIIGIGAYRHPDISGMVQSRTSAVKIGEILQNQYGFQLTTLLDEEAKKNDIMTALEKLSATSTNDDCVLIFFSGTGQYDRTGNYGWWLPYNAEPDNFMDFIDHNQVHELINSMKARHVLLLSDSAFTKVLVQSQADTSPPKSYLAANTNHSRQIVGIRHPSPWTEQSSEYTALADFFISRLMTQDSFVLSLRDIFHSQKDSAGKNFYLAPFRNAGHKGGDFLLAAVNIGKIFVDAEPSGADIKILNIKPVYQRGMILQAGRYHIQVSAKGFQTVREWVTIKPRENTTVSISLSKEPMETITVSPPAREPVVIKHPEPTQIPEPDHTDFVENSLGMKFVFIRAGSFVMGSPLTESGRRPDEHQTSITISKGFYLQDTEVTVGQWRQFIQHTGYKTQAETEGGTWVKIGANLMQHEKSFWDSPYYPQTDNHPVTCVSWNDVQQFIKWLNLHEESPGRYRLPTEKEWEYSCRAGTQTPFSFGLCLLNSQANFNGTKPLPNCPVTEFNLQPKPVRSYMANQWKLYDMHGNVMEWVSDIYTSKPGVQILSTQLSQYRVGRGGAWDSPAYACRSAFRISFSPHLRINNLGFRLVRNP